MRQAIRAISAGWLSLLAVSIFSFMTQAILARSLSLEEFGLFSAINNFIMIVMPLSNLGIGNFWLKKFAQYGWNGNLWVSSSLTLLAITLVVSWAGALVVGWQLWPSHLGQTLLLTTSPLLLMQTFNATASARFQLEERFTAYSIWRALPTISKFVIVLVMYFLGLGLMPIAASLCVSMILLGLAGFYLTYPMTSRQFNLVGHGPKSEATEPSTINHEEHKLIPILKETTPFALSSLFGLIFLQSDVLILSLLAGNEKAALYSAAFSVMAGIYMLPNVIFNQILLPKYHRWANRDSAKLLNIFRFGNAAMLLSGIATMLALIVAAPLVIPIIFGEKFNQTIHFLLWLSLCIPLRFVSSGVEACLATKENMKRRVIYQGLAATFNIASNFMLIPEIQAYGAIVSTIASEILLLALYFYGAQKHVFNTNVFSGWHLNYKALK